jgi:hypothetical protein
VYTRSDPGLAAHVLDLGAVGFGEGGKMLVKTIVQSHRNEKCGGIDVHLLDTTPRLLSRIEDRRYPSFSYILRP